MTEDATILVLAAKMMMDVLSCLANLSVTIKTGAGGHSTLPRLMALSAILLKRGMNRFPNQSLPARSMGRMTGQTAFCLLGKICVHPVDILSLMAGKAQCIGIITHEICLICQMGTMAHQAIAFCKRHMAVCVACGKIRMTTKTGGGQILPEQTFCFEAWAS